MVALTTHANEGFIFGQIAQLVEHEPEELGVLGSIPSLSSDEIEVRFLYLRLRASLMVKRLNRAFGGSTPLHASVG